MIKTRFAPSPTGLLHVGSVRTALFSWLYARHHKGKFVLRIEDTDVERSTKEAVQVILDGMKWLGLDWDEGPIYQTERMTEYQSVIKKMLAEGTAYYCYMPQNKLDELRATQLQKGLKPKYDGRWRPERRNQLSTEDQFDKKYSEQIGISPAIRFKNPESGKVSWHDLIKGRITFDNEELDDFIIARSDGMPTYNFCVAVDDWQMGMTHIIRGDDHINNTPRQINILSALQATIPQYGHISMIIGSDGQKLSKRHGAVSVLQYKEEGYLPSAMINYLARLGWSHGDEEIFDIGQLVSWFDLEHINNAPAQFNAEKLKWLNAHYLKNINPAELTEEISQRLPRLFDSKTVSLISAITLYQERTSTLQELAEELKFCYQDPIIDAQLMEAHIEETSLSALNELQSELTHLEDWHQPILHQLLKITVVKHHLKFPQVAMPLRILLTGKTQSPSIDAVMALLGKTIVLRRLKNISKG